MKLSLAWKLLIWFAVCIILLVVHTLSESAFGVMSLAAQRVVSFVGLILPAGAGAALGVMSLARKEGLTWLAVAGMILNSIFALFHLAIMLYAG